MSVTSSHGEKTKKCLVIVKQSSRIARRNYANVHTIQRTDSMAYSICTQVLLQFWTPSIFPFGNIVLELARFLQNCNVIANRSSGGIVARIGSSLVKIRAIKPNKWSKRFRWHMYEFKKLLSVQFSHSNKKPYRMPQFAYTLQIEIVSKILDFSVVITPAFDGDGSKLLPSPQQTSDTSLVSPSSQNFI